MVSTEVEAELQGVLELERELQTRVCRDNRSRVLELLAPDFTEIGASGRTWDLRSILELLEFQSDDGGDEIEVTGLVGRVLADRLILGAMGLRP